MWSKNKLANGCEHAGLLTESVKCICCLFFLSVYFFPTFFSSCIFQFVRRAQHHVPGGLVLQPGGVLAAMGGLHLRL